MRFCSYILVLYWTIITYWRIYQALWHFLSSHLCFFIGIEWEFGYLKSWCLGTGYRCIKFNSKHDLSFLEKSWFDCEFHDLYIHRAHISWYYIKALYQVILFFIFKYLHTPLLLSSLSFLKTSCNIKLKKENYLQSWLNKVLYINK
jgi:hypothetical protein